VTIWTANTLQLLCSWLFALSVVGYPVVGLLVAALDWPSRWMSAPFRAGVALIAAIVAVQCWQRPSPTKWTWALLAWLALYALRLVGNLTEAPIGARDELMFFILVVAMPVIALANSSLRDDDITLPLVCLAGTAVIFASVGEFLGVFGANSLTFSGRLQFSTLNGVTLGHTAATLLIAALALPLKETGPRVSIAFVVLVLFALATLSMTSARGAFVALAAALAFAFSCAPYGDKAHLWGRPAIVFILGAATLLFLQPVPIGPLVEKSFLVRIEADLRDKSVSAERIDKLQRFRPFIRERAEPQRKERMSFDDRATVERIALLKASGQAFLENPLTGISNWAANGGKYPHNSVLEAFQNLGMFGGAAFVCLLLVGIRRAWETLRSGEMLIPLLYVQAVVASQFSGSLYANAQLWITLAMLLGTSRDPRMRTRRSPLPVR
jgi:O-antigen ligase